MQRIFGERERPNCLYSRCMMSVMLCLQMHGIYKCWGGAYGGFFLWRELILNEHSKLRKRQHIIIILNSFAALKRTTSDGRCWWVPTKTTIHSRVHYEIWELNSHGLGFSVPNTFGPMKSPFFALEQWRCVSTWVRFGSKMPPYGMLVWQKFQTLTT